MSTTEDDPDREMFNKRGHWRGNSEACPMNHHLSDAWHKAAVWMMTLKHGGQGPDVTATAHLKVIYEAEELAENPSLEELADVFICLVGVAQNRGWSQAQVAEAVNRKVEINAARIWDQQVDGTWQHRAFIRSLED